MVSPMDEKKKCSCSSSDVRVVACSGACNVGQIVIDRDICSRVVEQVKEELAA